MKANYFIGLFMAVALLVGCGEGLTDDNTPPAKEDNTETPNEPNEPETPEEPNDPEEPEDPEEPIDPEEPEEVVLEAGYFGGEYYGDYYSPGVGNYYIHLSDNGFEDSGYALPNTVYYTFDLYSTYYGGEEVERLSLPEGTYRLDMDDTFTEGTFSVAYSKYYYTDANGDVVEQFQFEAGELVVTATEATLVATIAGKQHKVTFAGVADVADKRSATGEDVGGGDDGGDDGGEDDGNEDIVLPDTPRSTLEGDYTMTLDHHILMYQGYGDYYGTGLDNYTFAIWPEDYVGDHLQFDVMIPQGTFFYGTFTAGDEATAYSFLPGYLEVDGMSGYMRASWYYTDDGITMAPFVGGELVIGRSGSSMTVTFSVVDDKGNTITGEWSGSAMKYE